MRIERAKPLIDLHIALLGAMRKLGAEFDERWTGADNWNPHYTHKSSGRLQPGDSHEVSDIDLITRVSEDGDRMILHRFALESSNR